MNQLNTITTYIFYRGMLLLLHIREDKQYFSNGKWVLHRFAGLEEVVGGHVEPGESFEDAAMREILEETGLVVQEEDLNKFMDSEFGGGRINRIFYVVLTEEPKVNLKLNPDEEHDTARLVAVSDVPEVLAQKHSPFLKLLLQAHPELAAA